jgi:hypothetical protein
MADQQQLHATFFAFHKRDGAVLAPAAIAASIAALVFIAVVGVVVFNLLGGMAFFEWYREAMNASMKGAAPSPPPNPGGLLLIIPVYLLAIFFACVLAASFESACLRWMIRGERSGPLNLCFGADMWRVYGVYWVWLLFFLGTSLLFWIWMFVLGLGAAALGGKSNPALAGLVVMAGCIAWIIAWVHTAVRLAPAAAASIGAGHFEPLKAWSVSRGRFWALFGSFLLLFLIYVVALIVVNGVVMGSYYASLFSGVDWSRMQSDPSGFSAAYQSAMMAAAQKLTSSPTAIGLYLGGQLVIYAVAMTFYLLLFGVNARAVQAALEEGKLAHEPAAT